MGFRNRQIGDQHGQAAEIGDVRSHGRLLMQLCKVISGTLQVVDGRKSANEFDLKFLPRGVRWEFSRTTLISP